MIWRARPAMSAAADAAERATQWLLSLQMSSGAFPGGLHGGSHTTQAQPSIFNTGQILQGLVRAHAKTDVQRYCNRPLLPAIGWSRCSSRMARGLGPARIKAQPHTYYSMVAWALAELSRGCAENKYGFAAEKNLDWVLSHFTPTGWIDGINLRGHPNYLHFIAYVLQGALECGILCRRERCDRSGCEVSLDLAAQI